MIKIITSIFVISASVIGSSGSSYAISALEIIKKSEESPPPFEEIKDTIKNEIEDKKRTEMLEKWITDLKQNAKVEINEKLL